MMQPVPLSDGCRHVDGGVADYFALGSCARRERVLNIAYWAVRGPGERARCSRVRRLQKYPWGRLQ